MIVFTVNGTKFGCGEGPDSLPLPGRPGSLLDMDTPEDYQRIRSMIYPHLGRNEKND